MEGHHANHLYRDRLTIFCGGLEFPRRKCTYGLFVQPKTQTLINPDSSYVSFFIDHERECDITLVFCFACLLRIFWIGGMSRFRGSDAISYVERGKRILPSCDRVFCWGGLRGSPNVWN